VDQTTLPSRSYNRFNTTLQKVPEMQLPMIANYYALLH